MLKQQKQAMLFLIKLLGTIINNCGNKDEGNSSIEVVNVNKDNEKCDELFNSQVRANELLLNLLQEQLKLAKKE